MIWIVVAFAHAETPALPAFGADASVGYTVASLLGSWPEPGVHGSVYGRYEAFVVPRTAPGPRLGFSLWGSRSLFPLQNSNEEGILAPFDYLHYGLMTVLRSDPATRFGFNGGMGFGRLDLDDYWDGPMALPTLTFEAGLRSHIQERSYVDTNLRAHWSTARSETDAYWHEWWMVQLMIGVGAHLQ